MKNSNEMHVHLQTYLQISWKLDFNCRITLKLHQEQNQNQTEKLTSESGGFAPGNQGCEPASQEVIDDRPNSHDEGNHQNQTLEQVGLRLLQTHGIRHLEDLVEVDVDTELIDH